MEQNNSFSIIYKIDCVLTVFIFSLKYDDFPIQNQ